jgi:hypothetical protein
MMSKPTIESISPNSMLMYPLTAFSPVSPVTVVRPSSIRAKVSGGPKLSAHLASVGDISISITTPNVPATNEPIAAMPRAGPARPLSAIW